jgi:hypothetical protein
MTNKKKATPKSNPNKLQSNNNSAQVQRQRLLKALIETVGGLTTIQLREDHDIMAPAPRIYELRWRENHNIQKIFVRDSNAQGNTHSCARYILLSGKWNGGSAQ